MHSSMGFPGCRATHAAPLPFWAQVPVSGGLGAGRVPKDSIYKPQDLRIGAFINVHGRDFFLFDCDAFTRKYYTVGMGG